MGAIDLTINARVIWFVRSIQKSQIKAQGAKPEKIKAIGARFVLLRPAGYPLKSAFQEHPVVADPRLFQRYAQEQWYGEKLYSGCYLFDSRLYPDYAFQVVRVHPRSSVMGAQTTVKVEQKEKQRNIVSYDVRFEDIVGQETAKRKVKIVQRFLADPESFGRWAPKNILFYGLSGTGKTMVAKALSVETGVPMLAVKSTSLIGEFVGEGSRQIHSLYEKAEQMAPCIIFIDELDENDNVDARLREQSRYYETEFIKPEVEWRADGVVALNLFLPVDERTAEFAAIRCGEKMGLEDVTVVHKQAMHPSEGTYVELKGRVNFDINVNDLVIPEKIPVLSEEEIREVLNGCRF